MARTLRQVKQLQKDYRAGENLCPVLCAGDLFDKWNPPVELVNFALREIEDWYAVPGQHDLPYHNLKDWQRSAFGTLVEAGRIKYVQPDKPVWIEGPTPLRIHGFPFGEELVEIMEPFELSIEIALIHRYVWIDGKNPALADETSRMKAYSPRLQGYNIAVFGDNHTPFEGLYRHGCKVFNCGNLLRRRTDEQDYRPSVGLLKSNGNIERCFLDVSKDRLLEKEEKEPYDESESVREFIAEISSLEDADISFEDAMRTAISSVREEVTAEILKAMEKK